MKGWLKRRVDGIERRQKTTGRPVPIRTGRPVRSWPSVSSRPSAQKVSFQLLSLPVSCAAVSWTRSFQVPFAVSLDAFTV